MVCSGEAGWWHHVDREAGGERLGEASAAAGLLFRASCAPREAPGDVRVRNMPVVGADDHATHASGAYGNDVIGTPHPDRAAELGLRPGRACVNCPFRTPARQSPISGKCPRGFGSTLLQTPPADELVTVADDLESRHFGTVAIGKMHIRSDRRHGFEHRADAPGHDAFLAWDPAPRVLLRGCRSSRCGGRSGFLQRTGRLDPAAGQKPTVRLVWPTCDRKPRIPAMISAYP